MTWWWRFIFRSHKGTFKNFTISHWTNSQQNTVLRTMFPYQRHILMFFKYIWKNYANYLNFDCTARCMRQQFSNMGYRCKHIDKAGVRFTKLKLCLRWIKDVIKFKLRRCDKDGPRSCVSQSIFFTKLCLLSPSTKMQLLDRSYILTGSSQSYDTMAALLEAALWDGSVFSVIVEILWIMKII